MDIYAQGTGFLGTGASLMADITLIVYLLLIAPAIIGGWILAKKGLHRPHHKWLMTAVTIINWLFILALMVITFSLDIAPKFGSAPATPRYLLPALHALIGLPAQLVGTYIIYGMFKEDRDVAAARKRGERGRNLEKYWFKRAKPLMRLVSILWLMVTLLGVITYAVRYNVLHLAGSAATPTATEEAPAPDSTPEVTPEAGS